MTDELVIEVNLAPVHDLRLETSTETGLTQSVCSCGRYRSTAMQSRREAHKLGRSHVAYKFKQWKDAL